MTGRADFSDDEWQIISEAPTYAGLLVSSAQGGGFLWEAMAIARTFEEVRAHQPESQLLDDIVAGRPHVERLGFRSPEEARARAIEELRAARKLIMGKGEPGDLDAYARFVLELARKVAGAYPETDHPVSSAEHETFAAIRAAVGFEEPEPD
jgi:hypothetical protein